MQSLPARPSLESLRKQAKKLARDIAAGDAAAIARARAHLPHVDLPLTQRNAQLVIAREYGFPGWQDLIAEVSRRLGNGLELAAAQARRAIHDNDVDRLKQLLADYPALLSWLGDEDGAGLLGFATGAYGDSFDPERERVFTRATCAELLIDAGAVVTPKVIEGILQARARGLLELFRRSDLLPNTLKVHAALGDVDAVRASLRESGNVAAVISEAFLCASSFQHEALASVLLDRLIALDPELGARIDESVGRAAFIRDFIENRAQFSAQDGLWRLFVMRRIMLAVDGDPKAFVDALHRESWLLGEAYVGFQEGLIARATLHDRGPIIAALLDLDPAILRREPPPPSQAIEFAATYARTHLIPLLARIWPIPDDLPYTAALGNLSRVKHWFDDSGAPALGDLNEHYPYNDARARSHLHWEPPTAQQILDVALAWSVINRHLDVADFLLEHGADINTNWSSHEPSSILHELVGQVGTGENPANYESMQFLIDRGIDMTMKDYRWNSTARVWAIYAARDERMAAWLEDAERRRAQPAR
jgi:hypothetical protein